MKRLVGVCFALLLCTGCSLFSPRGLGHDPGVPPRPVEGTLRVIYVADTVDRFARPGDGSIASGVQTNLRNVTQFFSSVAQRLSLNYEPIEVRSELITGQPDPFDCTNVMRVVENASQNPADIIFFYYAGHGFNRLDPQGRIVANVLDSNGRAISQRVASETPFMACTGTSAAPNLLNVSERLQRAAPRLLVVMFDSCNSLGEYEPFSEPAAAPTGREIPINERLAELFLRQRGLVHITGSKPGQYSFYGSDGGIATNQFLRAITEEQVLTWRDVGVAFREVEVTTFRPGTRESRRYWQQPNMPLARTSVREARVHSLQFAQAAVRRGENEIPVPGNPSVGPATPPPAPVNPEIQHPGVPRAATFGLNRPDITTPGTPGAGPAPVPRAPSNPETMSPPSISPGALTAPMLQRGLAAPSLR